jgi:hypothetical protein
LQISNLRFQIADFRLRTSGVSAQTAQERRKFSIRISGIKVEMAFLGRVEVGELI